MELVRPTMLPDHRCNEIVTAIKKWLCHHRALNTNEFYLDETGFWVVALTERGLFELVPAWLHEPIQEGLQRSTPNPLDMVGRVVVRSVKTPVKAKSTLVP
jgi:hypothetical protein